MADRTKELVGSLGFILVSVLLIPVINDIIVDANLSGTPATIFAYVPTILSIVVFISIIKDMF